MTKAEFIKKMAKNTGFTQANCNVAFNGVSGTLEEIFAEGEGIVIGGFGSFTVKDKDACIRRNPATGEQIEVPAKKYVRFKVSQKLKDVVNEKIAN